MKLSIHIIKIMGNQEDAWLAHHRRNDEYPSSKPADDDDESMNFQTVKYAKKPVVKAVPKKPVVKAVPKTTTNTNVPKTTTNKATMPDVITELKKKFVAKFDMILDTLTKELEKKHAAQIAAKNAEIAVLTKDLEGVVAYLHETQALMNEAAIQGNV